MVEREVIWTKRALTDRTKLFDYWFEKTGSTDYPIKLNQIFSATIANLLILPESGILFDRKLSIRFTLVRYFRIYYSYTEQNVIVLAIWDTRRNPKTMDL